MRFKYLQGLIIELSKYILGHLFEFNTASYVLSLAYHTVRPGTDLAYRYNAVFIDKFFPLSIRVIVGKGCQYKWGFQ